MSDDKTIKILHLYPDDMNIYGDRGNVLTIARRVQWHGYKPLLTTYNPGNKLPTDADIVIGGGGQDSGQLVVGDDLLRIGDALHKMADNNVPMLMVCGLYQLFGNYFKTADGTEIPGIGIFKAKTIAGPTRLIGNVVCDSKFGELIGYENHSGRTYLNDPTQYLARVVKGAGNNGEDGTEGAKYKNVYGTYMHGSLLPKNPDFADALIEQAAIQKYGDFTGNVIDDRFAEKARAIAKSRPR